jgi:cysteinyl-tRNA synthetase
LRKREPLNAKFVRQGATRDLMMTSLRLYNTLTRRKEGFVPLDPSEIRMYVCGPTVYDFAHIGNARPVIVFDVLFRLLRQIYGTDRVTYVRNITDVDDKINARAARDFPGLPLNEAIRRVTETTANQFHQDVAALGCLPPTVEPRATDNIAQMVEIIGLLLKSGHAYIASGSEGREVLFAVASMPDYGALSNRKLDEQIEGARVAVEAHKRNPADFVLWKESSPGEPGWNAGFADTKGEVTIYGRPGWHIECSAMSRRYLGEVFDIHGGGIDLVFPHHENEIAQSTCAFGHALMAKVWMHNGFLQVEGQKMSKSLGNFVTIHELLASQTFGGRTWPGEVLRLAMLKTHYRQPIDFTLKALEEAESTLLSWHDSDGFEKVALVEKPDLPVPFLLALADDLNTSEAIAQIHSLKKTGQMTALKAVLTFLGLYSEVFLRPKDQLAKDDITPALRRQIEDRIAARIAARKAKNWAESDRIRAELDAMGLQLMDGKDADGDPTTDWTIK